MIKVKNIFHSYEGEGQFIGLKTLFFTYEPKSTTTIQQQDLDLVDYIYICTDIISYELLTYIEELCKTKVVTLDLDYELYNKFITVMPKCYYFLKYKKFNADLNIKPYISLKVEMNEDDCYLDKIKLANKLSNTYPRVYLMPLFSKNVGEMMTNNFQHINKKVHFAPPIQTIINIK